MTTEFNMDELENQVRRDLALCGIDYDALPSKLVLPTSTKPTVKSLAVPAVALVGILNPSRPLHFCLQLTKPIGAWVFGAHGT